MSDELRKKAVEMLLKGATLLAEPCPYCKGVRIMKDGKAFCISCGREPDEQKIQQVESGSEKEPISVGQTSIVASLNKKLEQLSKDLESEKDYEKQQRILKSINSLIETIKKLQK